MPIDFDQISQLYDTLFMIFSRSMKGMHKTRCIYFSETGVLNCCEVTYMGNKA